MKTNEIKIEQGVPIPAIGRKHPRTSIYLLDMLEIGDSIRYSYDDKMNVSNAMYNESKKQLNKIRFVGRTVQEDGIKYYRVWRVK